uniref:Gypsy retrotransposon integrase-like protein 1 n=1 Tax=Xenopus tropicalis TaxID=8364 RepID=A0A803JEM1_XENTR
MVSDIPLIIPGFLKTKIDIWYCKGVDSILATDVMEKRGWIVDLGNRAIWKDAKGKNPVLIDPADFEHVKAICPVNVSADEFMWPDTGSNLALKELVQRFPGLWAQGKNECGRLKDVLVDIKGPDPPPQRQYRLPPESLDSIAKVISDLEAAGVVRKTNSKCNNPLWPVKKQDGSWRLTIDLRVLNKYTPPSAPIVADIPDIMSKLMANAKFYSKIDIANGYFSIGLTESCQYKFAFTFQNQQYKFLVLPQGLHSSPTWFHRALADVLATFSRPECLLQYVDDILLQTVTEEEHLILLAELFELIYNSGFKMNTRKVVFLKPEVEYLGVQIGPGYRKPLQERMKAISVLPVPATQKALRKFLGFVNFSRDFIESFAEKARPLYDLLKGSESEFGPWTQDHQLAFETLKKELQMAPSLATIDQSAPFALQVHTSEAAVSAVLLQLQGGVWRPVGYFSKVLSPVEKGFDVCTRHLLGVHFAVLASEHIVGFNEICLQTPHTPLKLLLEKGISGVSPQRFSHWLVTLSTKPIKIDQKAKYVLPQLMQYEGHSHECEVNVEDAYPVLFRREANELDEPVFVDGSRFFSEGKYYTGYSIWYPNRNVSVKHKLPGHYSAQRAEIEAVKTVLTNEGNERKHPLVIYSDSSYVVRSLTDYLVVWQRRGFVDASNKILTQKETLEAVFDLATQTPALHAVVKVPAHRKGEDPISAGNAMADALAKEAALTGDMVIPSEAKIMLPVRKTDTQLPSFSEEQAKDQNLVDLRVNLTFPFVHENGVLCYDLDGKLRPVVPEHLQVPFTKYNHESLGHIGQQRLYEVLQDKFYWKKMKDTVEQVVSSCLICAQVNPCPKGQKVPLQHLAPADGPWSALQIDYIGPLQSGRYGLKYALVVVDIFSKWVEVIPVKRDDALTTAKVLWEHIFSRWGFPQILESDRGTHFTGQVMQATCAILGIKQRFHFVYHPISAGIVERMNRTLKSRISKMLLDKGNTWVEALPAVLMSIRGTTSSATQYTPFELMTGRKMCLTFPGEPKLSTPQKDAIAKSQWLQLLQSNLETILPHAASKMQKMTPPDFSKFKKGGMVMIKTFRKIGSWQSNWEGPFNILNTMGQVMVQVQRPPDSKHNKRRQQVFWVHADQFKLYVPTQ